MMFSTRLFSHDAVESRRKREYHLRSGCHRKDPANLCFEPVLTLTLARVARNGAFGQGCHGKVLVALVRSRSGLSVWITRIA